METEHKDRQTTPTQRRKQRSKSYNEFKLNYLVQNVISLFISVSFCMVLVVIVITHNIFESVHDPYEEMVLQKTSEDSLANLWSAVLYSLIAIGAIIFLTTIFAILYIYKFYKIIIGWLILTIFIAMYFFSYFLFRGVLLSYNIPMDIFTATLIHWNVGVTAMISIFWKGPLRVQQAFLIYIAARMALIFIKILHGWTTWIFLIVISIWDVVAVLAPLGPLKVLIETVEKRNEEVSPALIYSTVVYRAETASNRDQIENEPDQKASHSSADSSSLPESDQDESSPESEDDRSTTTTKSPGTTSAKKRPRRRKKRPHPSQEGTKLGIGDFVMYGVLIGKASMYGDWNVILACFVSILTGLGTTFLLLLTVNKALPALPISIALGLISCLFTGGIVQPFADRLLVEQIFI